MIHSLWGENITRVLSCFGHIPSEQSENQSKFYKQELGCEYFPSKVLMGVLFSHFRNILFLWFHLLKFNHIWILSWTSYWFSSDLQQSSILAGNIQVPCVHFSALPAKHDQRSHRQVSQGLCLRRDWGQFAWNREQNQRLHETVLWWSTSRGSYDN